MARDARTEARRKELRGFLQKIDRRTASWRSKMTWARYKLTPKLGEFPIPIELVPRILFWHRVFSMHPADSSIIYDKRGHFYLGHIREPGAGLIPGDSGAERRRKTSLRAIKARALIRQLSDGIRGLARREARARAKERRHWWKQRKRCRLLRKWKQRRRCRKLLRVHGRLYRRATWEPFFRDLSPNERKVYAAVSRDPRFRGPRWFRIFGDLKRSGLSWMSSYKAYFRKGLKVHLRYRSQIRAILKKERLPVQLMALPFVESMYNPWVRSFVGAMGLWQLMPMTGKELGLYIIPKRRRLRILPPIDERWDPVYATSAAAGFIRMCRYYFKRNWPLAITSYNQGPGRVLKVARLARSRYLPHIIRRSRKRHFGYDGRNFYAKFLAAALVLRRSSKWFPKAKPRPVKLKTFRLSHPIWPAQLQKITRIPVETLAQYNPMLYRLLKRKRHAIPAFIPLRLPQQLGPKLRKCRLKKSGSIKVIASRRGDSLYRIARRYGVPLRLLKRHNKALLGEPRRCESLRLHKKKRRAWRRLPWRVRRKRPKVARLRREQRRFYYRNCRSRRALFRRIPTATKVKLPAARLASPHGLRIYRVRGNEPLSWIACRACTTVWHLRSLNPGLRSIKRLKPGFNLRVPRCPHRRRRLFRRCYVHHYSRSRARRSKRRRRRRRRPRRRRMGD